MTKLARCRSCGGFQPGKTCPNCRAISPVTIVVGTAIAFTLMACYGRPPCADGTQNCHRAPTTDPALGEGGTPPDAAK